MSFGVLCMVRRRGTIILDGINAA